MKFSESVYFVSAHPPKMTKNLTGNSFITCQISMFWPPGCKNPSVKLNFTHGTLVKSQIGFFSTTFVQNPTFFPIFGPTFRAIFPPDSQFLQKTYTRDPLVSSSPIGMSQRSTPSTQNPTHFGQNLHFIWLSHTFQFSCFPSLQDCQTSLESQHKSCRYRQSFRGPRSKKNLYELYRFL